MAPQYYVLLHVVIGRSKGLQGLRAKESELMAATGDLGRLEASLLTRQLELEHSGACLEKMDGVHMHK